MPGNTAYIDGAATVFSSISLNGSGATLATQKILLPGTNNSSQLSYIDGGTQAFAITDNSGVVSLQVGLAAPRNTTINGPSLGTSGTAILPAFAFLSETSLGFFRSAASQVQLSYGTFNATGISATRYASSATTAQSGATAKLGQGELYFSVLSLTTNGGEFGFRSGNTVYRFQSTAVG